MNDKKVYQFLSYKKLLSWSYTRHNKVKIVHCAAGKTVTIIHDNTMSG